MIVLDASAILAFLRGEPGADEVEHMLLSGAVCSAANWSEVAQKVRSADADWAAARALLESFGLLVEPVTQEDAEQAAQLWRSGSGLSLADRLCISLARRLRTTAATADMAWEIFPEATLIR